jgi:hypothetical protein
VPRRLIAEAIDLIVFIAGRGTAPHRDDRRVAGSIRWRLRSPSISPQPLTTQETDMPSFPCPIATAFPPA